PVAGARVLVADEPVGPPLLPEREAVGSPEPKPARRPAPRAGLPREALLLAFGIWLARVFPLPPAAPAWQRCFWRASRGCGSPSPAPAASPAAQSESPSPPPVPLFGRTCRSM